MKKLFMGVAILAALVGLMAVAQGDGDTAQLRLEVANLGLRVSKLEHAAGQSPRSSGSGEGASAAAPVRSMVLVSIHQSNHQPNAEEIAQLKRQCSALMDTVNAAADQKAADFGQPVYTAHVRGGVRGWRGGVAGGYTVSNVGAVGRQVRADQHVENRYATLHAIKKQKLDALQHADAEPKQIILGHDGQTIITLETKHNLSSSLNNIAIGDLVTWSGTRQNADDDSETWLIRKIEKVAQ